MSVKSVTACRTETFQNLQLNAGAFLVGFDYESYTDASALRAALATALQDNTKLLGATRGGGTFVATSEIREPEVDGKRYRFVGGAFVDSVDAQLTGTLVEIRPEIFAKVLATGEATTSGKKTVVKMHTAIESGDYLPSLVWVGDMSDGGLVLIALKNALNNNGMTLTFSDKGEGTIPFEFHAYQDSVEDYDYAPFEVIFLGAVGTPGVSIAPKYSEINTTGSVTLTKTVNPANASVSYTSDNTSVATVSSGGVVSASAAGTVTITASITVDGTTYTDTATVRVVTASA